MNQQEKELCGLILGSAKQEILKKAIFSKPTDKDEQKTVLTRRVIGKKVQLQAETFRSDNKAVHRNFDPENPDVAEEILSLISSHSQVNLLTSAGECELRKSKKADKVTLIGSEKLRRAMVAGQGETVSADKNNRQKNHILTGNEPFLRHLGVSDTSGRIHDKKQAKFRQINRFLELIRDCLHALPEDGELRICDLCCGKSYLSFAAYHYFANILGRRVRMTGVDLKPDVVEHCNQTAKALGFDGLEFLCKDVSKYDAGEHVHLVISLHACDIATDLVLERAVKWEADVILSTPCCHHELNHAINCSALSFITDHSMLRQKLCDAATDALRLKFLESRGYGVVALELIDPDETPKNIMLRGIRKKNLTPDSPACLRAREEYEAARRFLTGGNHVQEILCPTVRE